LVYPNVKNMPPNAVMTFSVASGNPDGGTIEVREGNAQGKLLGTREVSASGGWDQYRSFSGALQNAAGTHSLCLTFKGGDGELMRLDWIKISTD
jgi:arabinoxylan arabinofuranohydrolase